MSKPDSVVIQTGSFQNHDDQHLLYMIPTYNPFSVLGNEFLALPLAFTTTYCDNCENIYEKTISIARHALANHDDSTMFYNSLVMQHLVHHNLMGFCIGFIGFLHVIQWWFSTLSKIYAANGCFLVQGAGIKYQAFVYYLLSLVTLLVSK
jgi:hypothetical protein